MSRYTRYQGAVIKDHGILLVRHKVHSTGRAYWVFPGGGIEGSESEEECVIREIKEETHLDVVIDRLVFDEPVPPDSVYKWMKTYLCHPVSGEARPGFEPEPEAAVNYAIAEVRWFDLRDESGWDVELFQDPFTYPQLVRLRQVLGYSS